MLIQMKEINIIPFFFTYKILDYLKLESNFSV